MALKKDKKIEILKNLAGLIRKPSLVFVNFHGLNVADTTEMRKSLRKNKVGYLVAKKTLIKKAFSEGKFGGSMPELPGETALVYGEEELAPAREIYGFQKKFKENLQIVGGVFGGKFVDKAEMTELASIPPLQTLYGQFVNIVNSPIQRFVAALGAIAENRK